MLLSNSRTRTRNFFDKQRRLPVAFGVGAVFGFNFFNRAFQLRVPHRVPRNKLWGQAH